MASAAPLAASNKLPRYVNTVVTQAKKRWLEPTDIARLLQQAHPLRELGLVATEPPMQPAGGQLFLVDRAVCRSFRQDGHNWEKKSDGNVKENHMKLKVDGADTLNCYYSYCRQQGGQAAAGQLPLTRRSYWLLGEEEEGLVLVHYLHSAKKGRQQVLPPGSRRTQAGAPCAPRRRRRKPSFDEGAEGAVASAGKRARAEAVAPQEGPQGPLELATQPSAQEARQARQQRRRQQQAQYAEQLGAPPQQLAEPAVATGEDDPPLLLDVDLPWSSLSVAAAPPLAASAPAHRRRCSGGIAQATWREECGEGPLKLELTFLSWSLPDPPAASDLAGQQGAAAAMLDGGALALAGGAGGCVGGPAAEASWVEGSQAPCTPSSKDGGWMEDWLAASALGGGGGTNSISNSTSMDGMLDGLVVNFEGLALEFMAGSHKAAVAGRRMWQRAVGRISAARGLRDWFQERPSA